ncbi:23S rRNA (guanosine(2251)-2'-O)-methyltransferase RlmB [Guggenheimella bovis]
MNEDKIYGKHAVEEALLSEQTINKVILQKDLNPKSIERILRLLTEKKIPYTWLERNKMDAIHEGHQGVIASVAAVAYAEWQDFAQGGLIVMLDGITDPQNLGAIIRSAYSFGAEGVIIPKRRSATVDALCYKASAGSASHLPVSRVSNLSFALDELKKRGYWVYGASAHHETSLKEISFPKATVLVIGSEDEGISALVEKKCDVLYTIDTKQFESLNASVALGISCYEYFRQNA